MCRNFWHRDNTIPIEIYNLLCRQSIKQVVHSISVVNGTLNIKVMKSLLYIFAVNTVLRSQKFSTHKRINIDQARITKFFVYKTSKQNLTQNRQIWQSPSCSTYIQYFWWKFVKYVVSCSQTLLAYRSCIVTWRAENCDAAVMIS